MRVFSDLLMKSSSLVLHDHADFPTSPRIGEFCFTGGILYIYAAINDISTWYPLTNRSLYYVHSQGVSSLFWEVSHGLGSVDVIIMVYDENNIVQLPELEFIDINTIHVHLVEPTKGKAVVFAAVNEYSATGSAYTFGTGLQFESNTLVSVDPATVVTRNAISKSSNYNANQWDEIYADASSGAFDITLPSDPALGAQVKIVDVKGVFQTNSVTIKRPSGTLIKGLNEDLILDVDRSVITLCWSGDISTGWIF